MDVSGHLPGRERLQGVGGCAFHVCFLVAVGVLPLLLCAVLGISCGMPGGPLWCVGVSVLVHAVCVSCVEGPLFAFTFLGLVAAAGRCVCQPLVVLCADWVCPNIGLEGMTLLQHAHC